MSLDFVGDHHWLMQEAAGGTTLADSGSVGGKTATINAETIAVRSGPGAAGSDLASAVDFVGGYFTLTPATLGADDNWSIFWRQSNDTAGVGKSLGDSTATPRLLFLSATSIGYKLTGVVPGTFTVTSGGTAWHSYMVVHDTGDNFKLYVDGALVETDTAQNGTFDFTRIGFAFDSSHDGGICDVRIFLSDETANAALIHADGLSAPENGVLNRIFDIFSTTVIR
jgi:hypothetical protein